MGSLIFWPIVGTAGVYFAVTTRQQRKNWQSRAWIAVAGLIVLFEAISLLSQGSMTHP